jgi:hypothetical protein
MKGKLMKHDTTEPSIPKEVITYAAGAIEVRLAEIARNTNQPEQELREWVAIFLLSSWTGISNYLPTLRGKTSKIYPSTRKMAMANNSHSKPSKKSSDSSHSVVRKRPKGSKSIRAFWAKYTPEERSKIMQERYKNRKAA